LPAAVSQRDGTNFCGRGEHSRPNKGGNIDVLLT
jgi:hypothetical protein